MTSLAEMREQIATSWDGLARLADELGPAAIAQPGPDGWAVKDHLTHVAAWERLLAGILRGQDRLEAMELQPTDPGTIDEINAALLRLHQGKSADEAVAYFRSTHADLLSLLSTMSDADMRLPYAHYQPSAASEEWSSRPVIDWVPENTIEHYKEHVGWIRSSVPEGGQSRG